MRKHIILASLFMLIAGYLQPAQSAQPVFNVIANTPVIQNMVPSSSQNLTYTINVPSPPPSNKGAFIIKCALAIGNTGIISATGFNPSTNGCINGVGFSGNTKTALVNVPLVAVSAGTTSMTLTFTMTHESGTHPVTAPPVVIQKNITVTSNANRAMTFKNYCPFPVYFAVSSGAAPALNVQNSNTACTTDSDCTTHAAFSRCVSGYCGGGLCINNKNAGPGSTSTDCKVQTDPNAGPPAADPSPCENYTCSFCNTSADCIAGASCSSADHLCYWNVPTPADSATKHYQLSAYSSGTPDSDTVSFTSYTSTNGYSLLWSGGIGGRTGCGGTLGTSTPFTGANACLTAGCNLGSGTGTDDSANGGCYLGQGLGASSTSTGGSNPTTQAEFTLVSLTPDTYDVTIINGTNIPINMYPATDGAAQAIATPAEYGNPYQCGSSGSATATVVSSSEPTKTLGACSWNFENTFLTGSTSHSKFPLNLGYRWVGNETSTPCTTDKTCTSLNSTYRCGLSSSAVETGSGSNITTCGKLLGYWSQDEICAANASYNPTSGNLSTEIVDCTAGSGGTFGGNTLINLLACTGPAGQSCYTSGANTSICCGCSSWTQVGGVPTNSAVITSCTTPNTLYWVDKILAGLNFLKAACPSAYVYPFDDKASTFTCPQNSGQSAVNYIIEFCPGQKTGGIV